MRRVAALFFGMAMCWQAHAVAIGEIPPDHLGRDRKGNDVNISDHHGKVVVVTFWASWCGYCRRELPVLENLQKVAGKDRVEVIAVNYKDDKDVYRAILRKLKDLQLTMVRDGSGDVGKAYGVEGIPRLFVIDKDGRIAYSHTGYDEEHSVDRIVDAVNRVLVQPALSANPPSNTGS